MKKWCTFLLMAVTLGGFAQDVHFSQYWAAPVAINPAQTGKFNGVVRGTFNYRNQWFLIPTQNSVAPYQTYQASVDAPITSDRLGNNKFGVGLMFFNDKAGDGALTTNYAMVSASYHQSLDRYGLWHLSFGLQGGVAVKRVNISDLIFESQLDGFGWNKNLNNGESTFQNKAIVYPDVNLGALLSAHPKDRFGFNFGFAVHHVAQPKEHFLTNDQETYLHRRFVAHGGLEFNAGYDKEWTIAPTFLVMVQAQAQQYNVGIGVNYQANDNIGIFGGGFYRVGDAAIVNLGVDVYNARIGVSYDINHSGLRGASRSQGAMEVSVVYTFKKQRDQDVDYPSYCPKF
ncbi:MAG: PorP/SprF family type IX secretion system membrane protein [Chitinophagales bacterium]